MTPSPAASKSQARRFAAQEAARPDPTKHMMAGGFKTMCGQTYAKAGVDRVTYDLDKVTCTKCLLAASSKVTARIYALVRAKATLKQADHFADVAVHEARALDDAV